MNDRVQQQTLHVDKNMPFLALDQVPRIEPVRINTGPPFSALFTLWLSMTQAVGLDRKIGCGCSRVDRSHYPCETAARASPRAKF
jgi:hypothetical protein